MKRGTWPASEGIIRETGSFLIGPTSAEPRNSTQGSVLEIHDADWNCPGNCRKASEDMNESFSCDTRKPERGDDSLFQKLLNDIASEHERALRELRLENQQLRKELESCQSEKITVQAPSDPPPGMPRSSQSWTSRQLNNPILNMQRQQTGSQQSGEDSFLLASVPLPGYASTTSDSNSINRKSRSVEELLSGSRKQPQDETRLAVTNARTSRASGLLKTASGVFTRASSRLSRASMMSGAKRSSIQSGFSKQSSVSRMGSQELANMQNTVARHSYLINKVAIAGRSSTVSVEGTLAGAVNKNRAAPFVGKQCKSATWTTASMHQAQMKVQSRDTQQTMVSVASGTSVTAMGPPTPKETRELTAHVLHHVWVEDVTLKRVMSHTHLAKMPTTHDLEERHESFSVGDDIHRIRSCATINLSIHDQPTTNVRVVQSGSNARLFWDLIAMLMILWDVIWLPMQVFSPPETTFIQAMRWAATLFWTFDMIASFFASYSHDGITEVRISKIAVHYVRTWFPIDLLLVVISWILIIVDSKKGGVGSALRILRMLRTLRLARVFKCTRIVQELQNHINSEYTSIVASIIRLVFMLLIANHLLACAWFHIGKTTYESALPNWLESGGFHDDHFAYKYTTSMHWSLTQFTPASMSVQPCNVPERSFTIVVIVIALVCFSSFLSSITNSITQLRVMSEDNNRQFWLLRKFLQDSEVPPQLSTRIIRYLEYALGNRKSQVQESQIKILSMLSDQLHRELQCATTVPHLRSHPLFAYINCVSNVTMHRLSSKAMTRISLASGDPLFFDGEVSSLMYFVIDGEMQYLQGELPKWVQPADWMCEPALWTLWIHQGEMLAMIETEVLSVDAHHFGEIVSANPGVLVHVRKYAEAFCKELNECDQSRLSDLKSFQNLCSEQISFAVGFQEGPEKKSARAVSYISGFLNNMWGGAPRRKTVAGNELLAPAPDSRDRMSSASSRSWNPEPSFNEAASSNPD